MLNQAVPIEPLDFKGLIKHHDEMDRTCSTYGGEEECI
jgi:hypothetical protein